LGRCSRNKPTVTAVSAIIPPSIATSVTITGTNFATDSTHVPIVEAVSSTNAYTRASVVSWASATSISATFDLPLGDYRVRVENPDGNAGMSTNAILQSSSAPTWTTAAGSLGTFAAEEAHKIGLANHVVPQDELMDTCKKIAQQILKNGPNAIAQSLSCVYAGYGKSISEGMEEEVNAFANLFETDETKEGLTAFVEKRKANFR